MLLDDLIEQLQEVRENHPDEDIEVSIAIQPNWPLEVRPVEVHTLSALSGTMDPGVKVWITTSEAGEYAPRIAGWAS